MTNSSERETNSSPITACFGITVRSLRRRLGISQQALAERAELHRTYIADVERGGRNVTLRTMERLAHGLEVSMAELLTQTAEAAGRLELAAGEPANPNVGNCAPKS